MRVEYTFDVIGYGECRIRTREIDEPFPPADEDLIHVVAFFFTTAIRFREFEAIRAAAHFQDQVWGRPARLYGDQRDTQVLDDLEREMDRIIRGRLLVVEQVAPVVAPKQNMPRRKASSSPTAPVAPPPEKAEFPVHFGLSFVDEFGDPITGFSSRVHLRHDGVQWTLSPDGGGTIRLDRPHGASTAWARLADQDAVGALCDAVKPLWDQAKRLQEHTEKVIREEDAETSIVYLRSPATQGSASAAKGDSTAVAVTQRDFRLVTDEPHRVSVQPWVELARLKGLYFDTNKCFLLPTAIPSVKELVSLCQRNSGGKVLVVGHTDTTGEPEVNDPLSLERAQSMVAYLTDDVDTWLEWYDPAKPLKKRWGPREDKLMLLGMSDYRSRPTGEDPVRWYQRTRGLRVDGIAGPETRRTLIAEYMASDGTSVQMATKLVAHGCGENFPLTEPPPEQAAWDRYSDQELRRVELFFFDSALGIQPAPPGDISPPGSTEYPEWVARSRAEHNLAAGSVSREVTVIEMHDALFRTNSCVVMPEGEVPARDRGENLSLALVGIVAASLRYNQEQPPKKLLVTGHCDTTGSVDANQPLSEERAASACALLVGDRERFRNLCHERHQVADYKQILSWVARAFSADDLTDAFDCDPGAIDNESFTGIEPVRNFQRDYNRNRVALGAAAPSLDEDGDMGPLTWGAVFDCYEFALRKELGEDEAGVAALRAKLSWVDPNRQALGFSEHHPIDNLGRDNYRSQANRRVEVLFFEHGEEPDLELAGGKPEMSDVYLPGKYRRDHLGPMTEARVKNWPIVVSTNAVETAGVRLDVLDAANEPVLSLTAEDGETVDSELCFELLPSDLPASCRFVTVRREIESHRTALVNPVQLRDALNLNSKRAAAMLRVRENSAALAKAGEDTDHLLGAGPSAPKSPGTFVMEVQWENPHHRFLKGMDVHGYNASAIGPLDLPVEGSGPGWKSFRVESWIDRVEILVTVPSTNPNAPNIERFWQQYKVVRKSGAQPILVPDNASTGHKKHPRVSPFGIKLKQKTPGAGVVQVVLDLLFLDVGEHVLHLGAKVNNTYALPSLLAQELTGTLLLVEHTGGMPTTWLVLITTDPPPASFLPGVFLMFRHEILVHREPGQQDAVRSAHKNSDDVDYVKALHYFFKPGPMTQGTIHRHGSYYPAEGTEEFRNYPGFDWDAQVHAAGKGLFLFMPLPHGHDFGIMNAASSSAQRALDSLVVALHANEYINPPPLESTPALGRVAIGGWSSGAATAYTWCGQGTGGRFIDEAYLFDGLLEAYAHNADLGGWFGLDPERRRLRLIGTAYTERAYIQIAAATRARHPAQEDHVWVRPGNLTYWYTDAIYHHAHTPNPPDTPRFDPLPSALSNETAKINVFLVDEDYSIIDADTDSDLILTSDHKNARQAVVKKAAHVEAASITAYDDGVRTDNRRPRTPVSNQKEFDDLMDWLRNTNDGDEKLRIAKVRHPWSVFGGEGADKHFRGYLTLCLDDSGF